MPQWQETHVPDLGITLVELPYVGTTSATTRRGDGGVSEHCPPAHFRPSACGWSIMRCMRAATRARGSRFTPIPTSHSTRRDLFHNVVRRRSEQNIPDARRPGERSGAQL
jgi:hypothetical protein